MDVIPKRAPLLAPLSPSKRPGERPGHEPYTTPFDVADVADPDGSPLDECSRRISPDTDDPSDDARYECSFRAARALSHATMHPTSLDHTLRATLALHTRDQIAVRDRIFIAFTHLAPPFLYGVGRNDARVGAGQGGGDALTDEADEVTQTVPLSVVRVVHRLKDRRHQ